MVMPIRIKRSMNALFHRKTVIVLYTLIPVMKCIHSITHPMEPPHLQILLWSSVVIYAALAVFAFRGSKAALVILSGLMLLSGIGNVLISTLIPAAWPTRVFRGLAGLYFAYGSVVVFRSRRGERRLKER